MFNDNLIIRWAKASFPTLHSLDHCEKNVFFLKEHRNPAPGPRHRGFPVALERPHRLRLSSRQWNRRENRSVAVSCEVSQASNPIASCLFRPVSSSICLTESAPHSCFFIMTWTVAPQKFPDLTRKCIVTIAAVVKMTATTFSSWWSCFFRRN